MGIPQGMTIFDEYGNFNLLRATQMGGSLRVTRGKSYPACVDLRPYSSRILNGTCPERLLDNLQLNAESPEMLFGLLRDSISFAMGDVSDEEVERLIEAKRGLFLWTRNHAQEKGVTHPGGILIRTVYRDEMIDVTPQLVASLFNPAALAILSLPAYSVLDIVAYGSVGTAAECYGRFGVYSRLAPPRTLEGAQSPVGIESFDDYMQAFHFGNFLNNNSGTWLALYGLAYCIAALVGDIRPCGIPEQLDSMEETIRCPPFNWLYDELVRRGALHDPFDRTTVFWSICRDGIENAREVGDGLYAALELSELLQPFPISTVSAGSVRSIFYGLIDIFDLREYFGISRSARFIFPE